MKFIHRDKGRKIILSYNTITRFFSENNSVYRNLFVRNLANVHRRNFNYQVSADTWISKGQQVVR